ncbi:hypothetical protein O77CONTIG1_01298 [Leptolyngbya sp. O-77]|nr:hypothetical protein O77CONTIG1_01298 [Leptolyngbya sp. O-77]
MMVGIARAAGMPQLNFTCPTGIDVHADEGGYVYINGEEARVQKFNDNYYEARLRGITVSITLNPDGTATVTYTRRNGANGICSPR